MKLINVDMNFEIGKIITIDGIEKFEIIAIAENCSDGLRFDIKSTTNNGHVICGCWLWDAGWHCV